MKILNTTGKYRQLNLAICIGTWFSVAIYGTFVLGQYEQSPGEKPTTIQQWTADKVSLVKNNKLLLFAHPRCPCTRASLAEFIGVLESTNSEGAVIFWVPDKEHLQDSEWVQSSLVNIAKEHPRLNIIFDPNGSITTDLGVSTSGHSIAMDSNGRLLFSGGVTRSRGHQGPNNGVTQLTRAIQEEADPHQPVMTYPVYGCSF